MTKLDRQEALTPIRNLLQQTLLLALLLAFAVTVVAHFFSRRLVSPVASLLDTTKEIASGNLAKRVSYSNRSDEVGQLALNFNLMADKLVETNKMLERKLQELDRINDSLNRFAYVVSHDLKSPLHAINGLIDVLKESLETHDDPDVQRMLVMAEGKAKHMLDLIAGILHYSVAGVVEEVKEPLRVRSLVLDVLEQLEVPAHISIKVDEMPTVMIERVLMLQVFQNLINNAIKYMDKPTGMVEVGSVADHDAVVFFVKDNGRGINSRHFDKIFDIFNRTARVPGIDSSGIGLSIVKKIIESKGGRVWVDSKVGEGSAFYFTLPLEDVVIPSSV